MSSHEVRITRTADTAIIEHADPTVWTRQVRFGPELASMSDADILAAHNRMLAAEAEAISSHENVCTEIPVGRPQIEYSDLSRQWVPRGGVVRCFIHDGAEVDGEPNVTIEIDDHELTLAEFGRMLSVHAGWGMRIAFVPEEYLSEHPAVEVREPEK